MVEKVIAIDAMGGDNAPFEIIYGAVDALEMNDIKIVLVGDEKLISDVLSKQSYDKSRIEIVNAASVIGNDESPTRAIKEKKDSSMAVGLNLVKTGYAQAFISAGNTGALLTGATIIIGRIKGIFRPALATLLPNIKGFSLLLDSGANVDCKPEYLVQFAEMGTIYMENILDVKKPSVGLINVGAEAEKGNVLAKATYELLHETKLNFYGNLEARDIPFGVVDVIVCDGFVGNIVLKLSEGLSSALLKMIKDALLSSFLSKVGALLSKQSFARIKKSFDYREVGGAPLLGLKSLVIKAHGSSDRLAIKGAIKQARSFVDKDIIKKFEKKINENK